MSIFKDEKFDNMDWMSQITETIESPLNDILASLPDRYELDTHTIVLAFEISILDRNKYVLHPRRLVDNLLSVANPKLSWEEREVIYDSFAFETSDDIRLDFTGDKPGLIGTVALVKTRNMLSDEDLQKMMGIEGLRELQTLPWNDRISISRVNEILDLLGHEPADLIKSKSIRKKMLFMVKRLKEIFEKNEWRIRDINLSNRVGVWITEYLRDGSLSALANFCKLKVMTHQNMPIYSVKEVV